MVPDYRQISQTITNSNDEDLIFALAEKLDFVNIQVLRKFYMTGMDFPQDTQPHCFSVLYAEMRNVHKLKIGPEALRKRMDKLVSMNLIQKVGRTNPANYFPLRGNEQLIRAVITKFMMNNGLLKSI